MKKLLTILLALLVVTGVVFADAVVTDGDTATLKLTSDVVGYFTHGFAASTAIPVDDHTSAATAGNTVGVTMTATVNELGVYYIYTNANADVTVTFELAPMETDVTDAFVPYVLSVPDGAEVTKTGRFADFDATFKLGGDNDGNAIEWATTNMWATAPKGTFVSTLAGSGTGTLIVPLNAAFSSNKDLPEGGYTGNVYAKISTN